MPNQHTKRRSEDAARKKRNKKRREARTAAAVAKQNKGAVTSKLSRDDILEVQGHKDDAEKIRYDLIPAGPLELLARLYTFGGIKYADDNWRKGITTRRLFGALMRHAWAFMRGQWLDDETGLPHLICVVFCAFSMVELHTQHDRKDLDDRFIPPLPLETETSDAALAAARKKKKETIKP